MKTLKAGIKGQDNLPKNQGKTQAVPFFVAARPS
jgi:hypothetical protein